MEKTEEDRTAQIAALDAQRQRMLPLKKPKNLLDAEHFYEIFAKNCFELVSYCGSGSFGEVWLVKDAQGIPVVLKIVNKHIDNKDKESTGGESYPGWQRERDGVTLYRDKQRGMTLDHLVNIHNAEETDDYFWYTMEPADSGVKIEVTGQDYHGETLLTRLNRDRAKHLTMPELHQLGNDLLDGLAELHEQGLIHRDLKPENILIVNNKIKIGDFGLLTSSLDQVSCGKCTPGYLPPEETGGGQINGRMKDLYAVGKIIYCAVSGYTNNDFPFMPYDVMHTRIGRRLNRFLLKACSNEPKERFADTTEFRAAFERCFESKIALLGHQTWFWCIMVLLAGVVLQTGLSMMQKQAIQELPPPGPTGGEPPVEPPKPGTNKFVQMWHAQNGRANLRHLYLFEQGIPAGLEVGWKGGNIIVNDDFLRWNAAEAGGELMLRVAEALPSRFEVVWLCQGSFAKMDARVSLETVGKPETMIWLGIRHGSVHVLQEPFGGAMLTREPPVTEEACGFINLHQLSYRDGRLRYWLDNVEIYSLTLSDKQQAQLKSCWLKLCFASQTAGSLAVRGLEVFELER